MKEVVSDDYMNFTKKQHGHKMLPRDRHCLITGVAENNIGESISNLLNKTGFAVHDYNKSTCNLTLNSGIHKMLHFHEDIDTLILCHGWTRLDWIEHQTYHSIQEAIDVNITSHIKIISEFVDMSIEKDYRKTIIIIGSMAASAVLNASSPYCAAKAGLQHFVKCIAWELAPKAFDVYLVNPSNVVDTPMTAFTVRELARYRSISMGDAWSYWSSSNPRKEFLTKHEIASLVCDLALGKHPYLSGTPLNLGGGQR